MALDSDPGIGIGTPISGSPGDKGVYRPPARTLLSLPRFASIMGINPIQFMQGDVFTSSPALWPAASLASPGEYDIWYQYEWQDPNKISRDELARIIAKAEHDIATHLGSWPAPVWITNENVRYTKYHRPELTALRGYTPDGRYKSIQLKYGQFIEGGQRATTLLGSPSVIYTDEDGDGYNETATITQSTALTDACELKLYFTGFSGDPRYEIRPVRSKSISGGNAVFVVDAWLLFDPERLAAYPGGTDLDPLVVTNSANYVATVDVYREYNDPENQCTLKWDGAPYTCTSCGGSGCPQCDPVTQIACLMGSDSSDVGDVRVAPASAYSNGVFTIGSFCTGFEPQWAMVNYRCGFQEDQDGNGCYEVPDDLAEAIAFMAVARLGRPLCTQSRNVEARVERLKEDLAYFSHTDQSEATVKVVTKDVIQNPFGTRRGEVEAWRTVKSRMKLGQSRVPLLASIS